MSKRFLNTLLPFALVFVLSAACASAQVGSLELPSAEEVMRATLLFIFGEGFPEYWLTYSGFMQNIIFPFIAIFVVMYGILTEIRIFGNRNVKFVLALMMALVSGYGVLITMRGFLVANSLLGTVGFGLLMLWGIFMWFLGGVFENFGIFSKKYTEATGRHLLRSARLSEQYARLTREIGELNAQIAMTKGTTPPELYDQLKEKLQRQKELQRELDEENKTSSGRGGGLNLGW